MAALQPVRGTKDLIGEDQRKHRHIIDTARRISALYGFEEWQTPIFEATEVFSRTLGDTSDVVTKEMYSFPDRGGDSLTLRPEGTAGVARALVSNGLTQSLPQKVFYAGPMFRYERPQRGRQRQFHQIGAELIGPSEPLADAEVIAMGWHILRELGVADGVVLEINTLGDLESRTAYRAALVEYFGAHRDALSEESVKRLQHNPLRILDSKDLGDKALMNEAPKMESFLSTGASHFYADLKRHLERLGIRYRENPHIVRGLDYYSHTAFEFVTDQLGAQGTVLAGGRYDGLIAEMGGPTTPAIGWAAGIERLAELIEAPNTPVAPVVVIPAGVDCEARAHNFAQALRRSGVRADMAYRGDLKRRLERAVKLGAKYAVFVLPVTLALRDLEAGTQSDLEWDQLIEYFK